MSGQKRAAHDEEAVRAVGRAAGYCWADRPSGPGSCTRPPGHTGSHVDHYNGRVSATATEGYRWPQ
ncbi:hypothetical protein ACFYNZ_15285 [Streptomyces kebangsaanensis]|uniref:Uncharacterized protein n=1 Tax=Streptomyces kebangsaanensis TaxID=864058 RepID=A0ABW6KSI7_9ACTN